MKVEIYKKSFEKYQAVKHQDTSPITGSSVIRTGGSFNDLYSASEKHPYFIFEERLDGEEYYNEHFKDPLYSCTKSYITLVIEKNGDKLGMKVFEGVTHRKEGRLWYQTTRNLDYISVNLKTGDVYNGYLYNYQKKRKFTKSIRRNCFSLEPLNSFKSKLKNILTKYTEKSYDEVSIFVSEFIFQIDQRQNFEYLSSEERLFRFYLSKRGIKYPNNFKVYVTELRNPEIKKILKKNDNKLVESVMIRNNLSGKKIRHALHHCDKLNLNLYETARTLFGDDWLNQDNGNVILDLLNAPTSWTHIPNRFKEFVSKEELKKVYILFKQAYIYENLNSITFMDHLRLYTELKIFGEVDLKWKSVESTSDFHEEHMDWTDKIQHYRMGDYTRHYPEYMYDMISKPLYSDFHPILLDTSSKYNEESNYQSNCVKSYIGKPNCLIISLRCGQSLEERATLEYRMTIKDGVVNADRVQSLGKYNQKLEEQWTTVLLKLDQVVLSCVRDKRFETVKLTKECKNGTILNSDTYWDENGNLKWTFQNIESSQSEHNFYLF
jgi:hypothetical protein